MSHRLDRPINWIIETPATTTALTVAEVKPHLRRTPTDVSEDGLIGDYLKAAQELMRTETAVFPVAQSYLGHLQEFRDISINYFPMASIDSIKFFDVNAVLQTLVEDTDYRVDLFSDPALIIFDESPELEDDKLSAIQIRFTVGYAIIPEDVKQAMRMIVADMFEGRQSDAFGVRINQLSRTTRDFLANMSHRKEV